MKKMKKIFEEYFRHWKIKFPEEDYKNNKPGQIVKQGWSINYIAGEENGRKFFEFSAMNRMTNHRHHKIYEDGTILDLDGLYDFFGYDPKIEGDEEKKRAEYEVHNNKVLKELGEKGLL